MNGKEERSPEVPDYYDYIVIGSGFGGSVSAMRLSEKGYHVLILEKGKRYAPDDFPHSNWNLPKYLWLPSLKWFGFMKLSFFRKMLVLSGVGVGGGSLVYANTLMEPKEPFYENIPIKSKDWKAILKPCIARASRMLGVVPAKNEYEDDDLLKQIAIEINKKDSFSGVNVGVYYSEDPKPMDPYFDGKGPLRTPCIECAGCMVGCRHNAKNTLDKNYLWFAEKNGAVLLPQTEVIRIETNDSNDIYCVSTVNLSSKIKRKFTSKGIIVSGGVLGTLNLLFKQKYTYKTLPKLSDRLGQHILSNSESISGVIGTDRKMNHGVAISSIIQADENTQVELCKFPDGSGSLFRLAFLAAGKGSPALRALKSILRIILHPVDFLKWFWYGHQAKTSLVVLVMQTLKNSLTFKWNGKKMKLYNGDKDEPIPVFIPEGYDILKRLAKKTNGVSVSALTETFFNMATTAHILGGCPMGETIEQGVVNDRFEVHGYQNMMILDGSIIPANIGVNPSLTITSLAEYAMDCIEPKKAET